MRVAALTPRLTLSRLVGEALIVLGVDSSHVNIEQPTGVTGQHCYGHGNFQDGFLWAFSFLHVHAPYPPFRLLTNLREPPKTRQTLIFVWPIGNSTQRQNTCY